MSAPIAGVVFDAYGTLFDVYAVEARLEALFPGKGHAISLRWRDKQIEYTRLRTRFGGAFAVIASRLRQAPAV